MVLLSESNSYISVVAFYHRLDNVHQCVIRAHKAFANKVHCPVHVVSSRYLDVLAGTASHMQLNLKEFSRAVVLIIIAKEALDFKRNTGIGQCTDN